MRFVQRAMRIAISLSFRLEGGLRVVVYSGVLNVLQTIFRYAE